LTSGARHRHQATLHSLHSLPVRQRVIFTTDHGVAPAYRSTIYRSSACLWKVSDVVLGYRYPVKRPIVKTSHSQNVPWSKRPQVKTYQC